MGTMTQTRLTPNMRVVYDTVEAAGQVAAAYVKRSEPVFFDTETTGLDPHGCKLVMIQMQQGNRTTVLFDCRRGDLRIVAALRPIFKQCLIVGHNLKFDLQFLLASGLGFMPERLHDTQTAEQVIYGLGMSEARASGTPMGLKDVVKRRTGIEMEKSARAWFYEPAPLDERPEDWDAPFPQDELAYAALDVACLPQVYAQQVEALSTRGLADAFALEMRSLPAIARMEHRGILIDVDGWRSFIAEKAEEAKAREDEALQVLGAAILDRRILAYDRDLDTYQALWDVRERYAAALKTEWECNRPQGAGATWGDFKRKMMGAFGLAHPMPAKPKLDLTPPNIGSTAQLTQAMTALGIPVPTKRGTDGELRPTTESVELEKLADRYPAMATLVAYRKASKFVQSFGETLLAQVSPATGRIHPDYQPIGASTGRMSCSKPNWQQIPSKGDGDRLRALVHPAQGCALVTADFSNIEMRILAELSGDEKLLEMFASGEDLHSYTARVMFSLDATVDPKTTIWKRDLTYRQIAKIINYGLVYGMGPSKLAKDTDISLDDAKTLLANYFLTFPGVRTWLDQTKREALRTWRSVTVAGRERYYTDPGQEPSFYGYKQAGDYRAALDEWKKQRAMIQRQATNTPIQGSSADITKLAIALFWENVSPKLAVIVAVVHDEIVVETPEQHAGAVALALSQAMTEACKTYLKRVAIPPVEAHIGERWAH